MTAEQKGLYDKYMVIKVVDGTVIENCFILRPDKDPAAVKALQAYAAETENNVLANEIYAWVGKLLQKPMTLEEYQALIDAGREVVIYCEIYNDEETYANIICKQVIVDRYGECPPIELLRFETYGKTWRAWASRPTDEERAAEPWEE